jgi:hypothetical protein
MLSLTTRLDSLLHHINQDQEFTAQISQRLLMLQSSMLTQIALMMLQRCSQLQQSIDKSLTRMSLLILLVTESMDTMSWMLLNSLNPLCTKRSLKWCLLQQSMKDNLYKRELLTKMKQTP